MKKKLIFMPIALLGVLALLQFGCDSDSDTAEDSCEAFSASECKTEIEASTCCSEDGSCYYLYNGTKYDNTDAGEIKLIDAMCPDISEEQTTKMHQLMAVQTQRLIEKARMSAVCH